MQRRTFITGSLLATAATAAAVWRARAGWSGRGRGAGFTVQAQPMPDGRLLVRQAGLAFGTTISVAAVHQDAEAALQAVGAALSQIRRVDALMTVYRPESQVGRLNATGLLDDPDPHLVRVLQFSQRLAALSDGAFDVTVQPLWSCHAEGKRRGRLPTPQELEAARELVDWRALDVSARRVELRRPGMAITLNGVAQGYAADLALAALRQGGVADALIDAGEFGAEGQRQPGQPWTVGLQHPRQPGAVIGAVSMDGRFLATSGDYATTFTDDFRSNHIFDPRTGRSPEGLSSATVLAASGMEADGLTKPMMVLDLPRARRLLAGFPGAGALWIDKDGRVVTSTAMTLVAA
jgi:thiamine biosynthesis lipoprotein